MQLVDNSLHARSLHADTGTDSIHLFAARVHSYLGAPSGLAGDAPYLDMAYKLVKYQGRPVLKLSPGKMTLASDKQLFRFMRPDGHLEKDIIGLRDDMFEDAEPLLQKVMDKGKTTSPSASLKQIQKTFFEEFQKLDIRFKSLEGAENDYPVSRSPRLKKLQTETIQKIRDKELGRS